MGPHPCGCGGFAESGARRTLEKCFNGAASMRMRRDPDSTNSVWFEDRLQWGRIHADAEGMITSVTSLAARARFNGAASMRMRRGALRGLVSRFVRWASMGPHPCGCGGPPECSGLVPEPRASMGPHPCGCGGHLTCLRLLPEMVQLQWGRIHADAEGPPAEFLFVAVESLQWGRCGGQLARLKLQGEARASMGPHPCGCGGECPRSPTPTHHNLLQWGRIHADAEGFDACRASLDADRLQWGRIHADAEGRPEELLTALSCIASMGPHPCGCGGKVPTRDGLCA